MWFISISLCSRKKYKKIIESKDQEIFNLNEQIRDRKLPEYDKWNYGFPNTNGNF